MYVVRVSLGPTTEGGLGDLDVSLRTPLLGIEGVSAVEGVYVDPGERTAIIPLVVDDDLELPAKQVGYAIRDVATQGLVGRSLNVRVYMAAPSPEMCPLCKRVGQHDWSKHASSSEPTTGFIQL